MLDVLPSGFDGMSMFLIVGGALAVIMLIWDTVEVGRNDAANLINAVFGARVLSRQAAVWVAGLGVLLGAAASSPVMETARKKIFEPTMLDTVEKAVAIYVAVYIVDTILLYGYSAFGMPVSTTACLVFELLGASFALGGYQIIHWDKAGAVITAIVLSIFISGVAGFMLQRAVRGAIRDKGHQLSALLLHGGWIAGGMLAGLSYFMLVKGMKNVAVIKAFNDYLHHSAYGTSTFVLSLWVLFAAVIHMSLVIFRKRAAKWVFPVVAIIGTGCMGFAFGQNDLANCASPGLAALTLVCHWEQGVEIGTSIPIPWYMLLFCGALLLVGMTTRNAARVTRAQVHAGSMAHNVALWAPLWCIKLARWMLNFRSEAPTLAPPARLTEEGKTTHYDAVRACTILTVSASVIATASGLGLPVSTTYVAFAAIVATGAADRIMHRGDADLKLARTIWVIFSWFAAAVVAAIAACGVCLVVFHLGVVGIFVGVSGNLLLRLILKKRGDAHEQLTRRQARDRMHPERYTDFEG